MALTGQQYEALTDALVVAFPDQESLDMMVRFKLGRPLNTIAPAGTLNTVVYKLLVMGGVRMWWLPCTIGGGPDHNRGVLFSAILPRLQKKNLV